MPKQRIGAASYRDREPEARELAESILHSADTRELRDVMDTVAGHVLMARNAALWATGAACCADRPEAERCSHVTGEFDAMAQSPALADLAAKLRHSYALLDASLHLLHTAGEELEGMASEDSAKSEVVPPQGCRPPGHED